ncbi:MAG TPA: VOC family protein [Nitrospiria bacterium]|nr:VOC family protein [Nitrospiria bacterium]
MKIIDIAFTVYPVTNLKRARRFYEETLGLHAARVFGDEDKGMIEYDIGPTTLAIGCGASQFRPSSGRAAARS